MNEKDYEQPTDTQDVYEDDIPRIIGACELCEEELWDGQEIWTDDEGNRFCSEECAKEFHGIHPIEDER